MAPHVDPPLWPASPPQIKTFVAARDALCAGDLDFVYATDGVGTVRFSYPSGVATDTLNPRNFPDGRPPEYTSECRRKFEIVPTCPC